MLFIIRGEVEQLEIHTYSNSSQFQVHLWKLLQTSIKASRFLSSSSSFLVTAEESMPSPVALEIDEITGPDSEPNVDRASLKRRASLSCDSMLLIWA